MHRFPLNHPYIQEFSTKIKAITAGYIGESYTDRFLQQSDFPKSHEIYKDLYIQTGPESYLQIDTLIVTQKYIAILEIKNIKGKIYFQKSPKQLVRELNGTTTTYKCPEQQILRHYMKLQKLLMHLKIDIPIHCRIIFAFSSIHVMDPPEEVPVLMACDLPNHLHKLNQLPDVITPYTFNKLTHFLSSHINTNHPKPVADQFNFDWNSLSKGIFCPNCKTELSLKKSCPDCKISRKKLCQLAIEEWFYLCKTTISNRECVQFLKLQNKHQATYILKSLDLEPINSNKYRRYTFTTAFLTTKESSNFVK